MHKDTTLLFSYPTYIEEENLQREIHAHTFGVTAFTFTELCSVIYLRRVKGIHVFVIVT